jgi:hypothetical protein
VVASRQASLVAFDEQRADSPVLLFIRHALVDDQTCADFHLALVQRVLVPFLGCFRSFEPATPAKIGPIVMKELGTYRYFFYIIASLSTVLSLLQAYNALISGVFWVFYAAIVFQLAMGVLQFARMILLPLHMTHD